MTASRWDISATAPTRPDAAAALIGATYHCLDERDGLVVYDKPTVQKDDRPVPPRAPDAGLHPRARTIT